jgi:hypothetical protein
VPTTDHYDLVRNLMRRSAETVAFGEGIANERYLHHGLSAELQRQGFHLDLTDVRRSALHPEWPTWKVRTGIAFARYRNAGRRLLPADADGSEGHLDFALGGYDRPAVGIELLLAEGWHHEDFVGDCVKIFDPRTPFSTAVSFTIVMRRNGLPGRGDERRLDSHINEGVQEALRRLGGQHATARRTLLVITEVAPSGDRRHWCTRNGTVPLARSLASL